MSTRWFSLACICLLGSGGCHFSQLDDPNEIQSQVPMDGAVIQRNIADAYTYLSARVQRGEISESQKSQIILKMVQDITSHIEVAKIPENSAWRFGDIFRQAGDLGTSRALYERAVEIASTEDRRVNDSLQLARVMALEGDVEGAIRVAEGTFTAAATDKAPILMSALYEIYPAGEGKGKDVELAQFLQSAIEQHRLVEVDPESESGKAFLATSNMHLSKAWDRVLRTFARASRPDLFDKAIKRREAIETKSGRV